MYGTLAPGRENYHWLSDLAGEWSEGWVRGALHQTGWGATRGYPALGWNPDAVRVPVWVLSSPELPGKWAELDAFEGPDYLRGLITVSMGPGMTVSNIYFARESL